MAGKSSSNSQFPKSYCLSKHPQLTKSSNPIYYTPPETPTLMPIGNPFPLFEFQSPCDHVHRVLPATSTVDFNLEGQYIPTQDSFDPLVPNCADMGGGNYSLSPHVPDIELNFQHELQYHSEEEYPFDFAFEFENISGRIPNSHGISCTSLLDIIMPLTEFAVYELMPSSNQIVILDSTLSLESALGFLNFSNISAVPIWNNDKCYIYEILSPCNILFNFALQIIDEPDLNSYSFVKKLLCEIFPINMDPHLITIPSESNLYDACHILLDNGLLYAPVIDKYTQSISQVLSLKDLLSVLYLKIVSLHELPTFFLSTLKQLEICSSPYIDGLSSSRIILDAFKLFANDISIVPIISKEGVLIDTLSKKDGIRILTEFPRLDLSRLSIQEVLSKGIPRTNETLFCSHNDTLIDVISLFQKTNSYWLIIVNNYGLHTGVVKLSDILKILLLTFNKY